MTDRSSHTFFPGERAVNTASSDIEMMAKALKGAAADILIAKSTDYTAAHANTVIVRKCTFALTDADGNIHRWYNATGYTVTITASAGAIVGTPTGNANVSFVNGEATISLAINAACHNNAGANTIVLTAQAVNGITPSGATLTHTITFT